MVTVKDMLVCPKCNKRMMGRSHPQKFGMEYFAHCCHQYFGVNELVNQWNYDAGDLFGYVFDTGKYLKGIVDKYYPARTFYSEFDSGEPYWDTLAERVDAYEMVNRMLLGIPEYDDYLDLKETEYDALGIGVQ
jgi:hypothetical protein